MTGPAETRAAAEEAKGQALVSVGILPVEVRQRLAMLQLLSRSAAELGKLGWGSKLEESTRRAVADWGRRFGLDVTTEIDVLGNSIYPNGRYYLRRLGELVAENLVDYAYADHVNRDPRLDALGEAGAAEQQRRELERIRYNVPEDAQGAVVFHVKLHSMGREVVGVNWCGDEGRTKIGFGGSLKKGAEADPIGFLEPAKTAETRAARRCMRQIVSHVPKMNREVEDMMAAAEPLARRIEAEVEAFDRDPPRANKSQVMLTKVGADGEAQQRLKAPDGGPVTEVIETVATPRVPAQGPPGDAYMEPPPGQGPPPLSQEELDLLEDQRLAELERRHGPGEPEE